MDVEYPAHKKNELLPTLVLAATWAVWNSFFAKDIDYEHMNGSPYCTYNYRVENTLEPYPCRFLKVNEILPNSLHVSKPDTKMNL